MVKHPKQFPIAAVLLLACVFSSNALAQTLTLVQMGTNRAMLQARGPENLGYRLEASVDNENWEDFGDEATGVWRYVIDASKDQKQFFRLRAWPLEDAAITIVLAGDSTVADFAANSERFYGWGHTFGQYLKPNVRLINFSVPFQSSKSFLTSIQKDNLLLIKPEFVIVQFGLVDAWDIEATKTTVPEYEANLRVAIQLIRDFKGTPILVTPPVWRVFDPEGHIYPWLEDRAAVVRKLAEELQTYLIDLNKTSMALYNELGPVASEYITWPDDWAHFTLAGSEVIAGLVAKDLPPILQPQRLENSPPAPRP